MRFLTTGVCGYCGTPMIGTGLCAYHHAPVDDRWAATNRIMCNLLHRGIEPRRLSEADRRDGDRVDETTVPSEVLTAAA